MGWAIIEFEGRVAGFSDFDLFAVQHFLTEESTKLNSNDENEVELRRFLRGWDWLGPGVFVGVDPGGFIQGSNARKAALLKLIDETARRISRFGSHVPLDYLERHVNRKGAWYMKPQPVKQFLDLLEKYGDLVRGNGRTV
jgi:hypothetical protein